MMRFLACSVAIFVACGPKPAPVAPQDPVQPASAETHSENHSAAKPPATNATSPAPSGDAAHCLFVEPEHRVVRCYWQREKCEEQLAFNRDSKIVAKQQCESFAEAHCFDEKGQPEACYPTKSDCETTVAKFKQRKRPVSGCVARKGPR